MAIISSGDLTLLRSEFHTTTPYMSFADKPIIWSAQITSSPSRGTMSLPFVSGSGANFSLIKAGQEVWFGTSAGAKDLGVSRVRSVSSGDGGVTGTLGIAQNTIPYSTPTYVSFILFFPLFPKFSKLAGTGLAPIFYKDTDILYTDQNENINPIIIAGENRAGFLSGASVVINPHLEDSYSLIGAAISSYSATSLSLHGTPTIAINGSTGVGTITFTTAGQYWIEYSITDSNGKTQKSYRFYYIHSTDATSEHYPFVDFQLKSINGAWTSGGWVGNFTASDNATLTDIHDQTIGIVWGVNQYGSTTKNITLLPDESNTLLSGYLNKENITQDKDTGVGQIAFTIETIESLMRKHYEFSLSLEATQGTPSDWYEFENNLTIPKALHHFWLWHSTLLEIVDVFLDVNNTLRAFVEFNDGNLYSMADTLSFSQGIRYHVVCDKAGRIRLTPDVQLLTDTERAALSIVQDIQDLDESGTITVIRNTINKSAFVKTSGFAWDGTFSTDCAQPLSSPCPSVEAFCASAPTQKPADTGAGISAYDRQTFTSQDHANKIAGRYFAKLNNEFSEFRMKFSGNYSGVADVAYPYFWTTSINTVDTERGFVWVNQNLIARSVNITITDGVVSTNVIFEPEEDGFDGVPAICLGDLNIGDYDFDFPAIPDLDIGFGGSVLLTGSSVYRKDSTGWTLLTSEQTSDLVKDPFWQIKQGSTNPANAIVWRSGVGYIKRSTDVGTTWTTMSPGTPPNDAGDSPAPTLANVDIAVIEGSQIVDGTYVFGVRWQNGSGEWRSWILTTDDDGATWTWESVGVASSVIGKFGLLPYGTSSTDSHNSIPRDFMVSLDGNKIIVAYLDTTPTNPSLNVVVGTVSASSITYGTPVVVKDNVDSDPDQFTICKMDSTHFIVGYKLETDITGATTDESDGFLRVGSVSGTTITLGAEYKFLDYNTDIATRRWNGMKIVRLTDSKALMTFCPEAPISAFTVATSFKALVINISGTTVSSTGALYSFLGTDQVMAVDITALSSTNVVASIGIRRGTSIYYVDVYSAVLTVSGSTIAIGSTYPIETTNDCAFNRVCVVNTSKVMFVHEEFDGVNTITAGHIGTITGTVIGIGPQNDIDTIVTSTEEHLSSNLVQVEDDLAMYGYIYADNTLFTYHPTIKTLAVSGNTITVSFTDSLASGCTYGADGFHTAIPLTTVTFAQLYTDDTASQGAVRAVGSGLENKVLGVSIGKGSGLSMYLTSYNGALNKLMLFVYSLPTLTLSNAWTLDTTTEAQLNAKSSIAYPYTLYGDDDNILIFGRFNGGHIKYSTNGGSTWTSFISDWGADHCGAFDYDGLNVVAVRNGVNKLYAGSFSGGLTPRTIIPFSVNPHSLKLTYYAVYACNDSADPLMVISSTGNLLTYGNITYDHGTANGINAIEAF